MSRFLRSTGQRIEILRWYECGPEDTFMEFHDRLFALGFLRSLMSDPFNMVTLRSALVGILQDTEDTSRLTDHEILEQIAEQIARGYVRLVLREGEALQTSGGAGSWSGSQETTEGEAASSQTQTADREETDSEVTELTTETGPVTPTERREPPREAAPQQPSEEDEPLVPEAAAASQAGVLAAAAESGAPFCECWPEEEGPGPGQAQAEAEEPEQAVSVAETTSTETEAAEEVVQPVAAEEESEEDEPLVPEEAASSQAAVMAKAAESGAALCECWTQE